MQDLLKMNFNLKHLDCCNNLNHHQSRICCDHTYYEENNQQRLMSKNKRITLYSSKHKKIAPNFFCRKELKSMRKVPCTIDLSTYSQWR